MPQSASPARPPRSAPKKRRCLAIVLAAGKGTRLPGSRPKVLVECLGEPLLAHVRRAVAAVRPDATVVLVGHGREIVEPWLEKHWPDATPVVQVPQSGTGHAVRVALAAVPEFVGDVWVVCGDVPQLEATDLRDLLAAHRAAGGLGAVLVGRAADPGHLGRIVRSEDGRLARIVEARDATEAELRLTEFNTGIYVFDAAGLRAAVASLPTRNAQGEEYVTDAVGALAAVGRFEAVAARDGAALLGVNSPVDLANAFERLRVREVARHMAAGVQVLDPKSTILEVGVTIAPGARILPFTLVGHGCRIGADCTVGPYAHLRGGTVLRAGAQIGNFVEVKATTLGEGAKAKHLTYLGDADIGAGANIGCGTITANYDGVRKHRTKVGARARIGSGTVLVAPVRVGAGSVTGANAVVVAGSNVPAGRTAVGVPARVLPSRHQGAKVVAGKSSARKAGGKARSTSTKGRTR